MENVEQKLGSEITDRIRFFFNNIDEKIEKQINGTDHGVVEICIKYGKVYMVNVNNSILISKESSPDLEKK